MAGELLVKLLTPSAKAPVKGKDGDSGYDVFIDNFKEAYVKKAYAEVPLIADENGIIPGVTSVVGDKEPVAITLNPGERALLGAGFQAKVAIDDGKTYELQVRPRSGASKKNGITVLNTPGTVDSKYRGEVCVLVINLGLVAVKINKGDRVAQVVPAEVPQLDVKIVDVLDVTDRGASGFESTGRA
jgi:dUTP pyrophosphatase